MVIPSAVILMIRSILDIGDLLSFHMKFCFVQFFSLSVKNLNRNLMGIVLNLWIIIGRMAIFTLILTICDYGKSFYLLGSLSDSFSQGPEDFTVKAFLIYLKILYLCFKDYYKQAKCFLFLIFYVSSQYIGKLLSFVC